MRVIQTKVYEFEELSDSAKEKAIESLSDINVDYEWWDGVYEDAKQIGLKIQSFDLDRNLHCVIDPMVSAAECAANIIREHGSSCSTYNVATDFIEAHDAILAKECEDELIELEESFLCQLADEYAHILQRDYEYLISDEAIIEAINVNECEFTEDGKLI